MDFLKIFKFGERGEIHGEKSAHQEHAYLTFNRDRLFL